MNLDRSSQSHQHLDLAQVFLDAQLPDEALEAVRQSQRLDPDHADTRIMEARIQLARHQPRAALAALDVHARLDSSQAHCPDAVMLRAQALAQTHETAHARRMLGQLIEMFPDDVRAYRLLAATQIRQRRIGEAIESFQQVLRLEPSDDAVRRTLAQLQSSQHPQNAVELLQQSTEQRHQPQQQLTAARLYHQVGRLREAEEIYSQLLSERPADRQVWLEAGLLSDAMGASAKAMRRLEHAAQLGQFRNGPALEALSRCYMHRGQITQAGRMWFRLMQLDGADLNAVAGLTVCALAMSRKKLTSRLFKRLGVLGGADERRRELARQWTHLPLGQLAQQTPRQATITSPLVSLLRQSADTFEAHAQRLPNRADTHYHMARCLAALGDQPAASRAVETAVTLNDHYNDAILFQTQLTESLAA